MNPKGNPVTTHSSAVHSLLPPLGPNFVCSISYPKVSPALFPSSPIALLPTHVGPWFPPFKASPTFIVVFPQIIFHSSPNDSHPHTPQFCVYFPIDMISPTQAARLPIHLGDGNLRNRSAEAKARFPPLCRKGANSCHVKCFHISLPHVQSCFLIEPVLTSTAKGREKFRSTFSKSILPLLKRCP